MTYDDETDGPLSREERERIERLRRGLSGTSSADTGRCPSSELSDADVAWLAGIGLCDLRPARESEEIKRLSRALSGSSSGARDDVQTFSPEISTADAVWLAELGVGLPDA